MNHSVTQKNVDIVFLDRYKITRFFAEGGKNKGLVVRMMLLAAIVGASSGCNTNGKAVSSIVKSHSINIEKKAPAQQALIAGRYIKLDKQGQPLKNQQVSYKEQAWQCVKDVKTGLIWEVKTLEGLHNKKDEYNWWNDSFKFKDKVNQQGWCGATDWRVPNFEELRALVYCSNGMPQKEAWIETCSGKNDSKGPYQRPVIEQQVFPNTQDSFYWSSSPYADYAFNAWYVNFYLGYGHTSSKGDNFHVRLVRSGQ